MNCACGKDQINAKVARANAFFTLTFGLIFLLTSWKWIVFVMLGDFLIKVFLGPKYSPFSQLNMRIMRWLKVEPKMIFAPPKRFALKVGLVFSILIALSYYTGYWKISIILNVILTIFADLELFFEFCMGCWFYSYWMKLFKKS